MLAAADPYPLKAALEAVFQAVSTWGEHYPELLEEIRAVCADRVEEWADLQLTRHEGVAAAVTTGLLKRPAVTAQVSREDKVRVVEELTRDASVATEVTMGSPAPARCRVQDHVR
ncbi:DUF6192 family protein [Streptomyces sp. NPDC057494]|uniref:DUF6192 family protein n=1 Tax=Streptomyces sp. NPDC057494 TaxID=3346148 RepID=UPI0036B7B3CF